MGFLYAHAKHLKILAKLCGDKWQSIWTYLAKYLDIVGEKVIKVSVSTTKAF